MIFGQKFNDSEELLKEIDLDRSNLALKPKIPKFIHEVLKSKACRYAIKFG